jgi:carbamoyl-phosphate synthase large subunit
MPRWDISKFKKAERRIGPQMKSVGEVMAIGRKFEEALQKAIRMLDIRKNGFVANDLLFAEEEIKEELKKPTDQRIFAVAEAMKNNISIDEIHSLTRIDRWFLKGMKNIIRIEEELRKYKEIENIPKEILLDAKQNGFSDYQIAKIVVNDEVEKNTFEVRKYRKRIGILPVAKQIDTLAAEYPAKTNYIYLTYNGNESDVDFSGEKKIIVLGSGVYRIGSSVEFDWCAVNSILALRENGFSTVMINYNPETVSTDYDICDKLYFDELTYERILDIYEMENPEGIIISMGGQIPNNLSLKFLTDKVKILGTSPANIDRAENRHKFSALLDKLNIDQPEWKELTNISEIKNFASKVGYPVLIRPSYVLSGAAMNVAFNEKDIEIFIRQATDISTEHPIVVSKFITGAKELEIDAVAQKGKLITHAITEHVENAGVHSGDATMVFPPQNVYLETMRRILEITNKIAKELEITGPFNIQFLAKDNKIKVIECNLRASRSFPFVSKVSKVNFIELATKAIIGSHLEKIDSMNINYVGVKAPQFSFSRLHGADPILNVEMTSTGEVACLGDDLNEAFLKSLIAAGMKIPNSSVLLSIGGDENKFKLLESIKTLKKIGFDIYATEHTSEFLKENKIENTPVEKIHASAKNNVLNLLEDKKVDLVINIPIDFTDQELEDEYIIRRKTVDSAIPLITNLQLAKLFIESVEKKKTNDLMIKSWDEY